MYKICFVFIVSVHIKADLYTVIINNTCLKLIMLV